MAVLSHDFLHHTASLRGMHPCFSCALDWTTMTPMDNTSCCHRKTPDVQPLRVGLRQSTSENMAAWSSRSTGSTMIFATGRNRMDALVDCKANHYPEQECS